ncbi:hypothetical protein Q8A73_013778 [Channa argus]|nr:hypothetical protein Q8A73_013778 [Channa argus]
MFAIFGFSAGPESWDDPGRGRGLWGSKLKAFCLLCQAEEWSPIKQRCLFPLPRILLKLPPEPLPFYPCHPTHPLNTLQGTVRTFSQ